jgi:signal transduction histidine kinase
LERFLLGLPLAVVALRRDAAVAFANDRARTLLGADSVRAGRTFEVPPPLHALAEQLRSASSSLGPTTVEVDGRVMRVCGVAATATEPAVLLLEDATEELLHERAMHDFVRNAAHQLRTPLTGITAAIQTLQAGAKHRPEELDQFLGHLETQALRLTRIMRALLALARAQSGEQVRLDSVELAPLLADVAAVQGRPGVRIPIECDSSLAVLAVPELLSETLAALVDNAVNHTLEGDVRLSAVAVDGGVALSVSDSGPGIPLELQEQVFEPFYRVADTGAGYGLGLAIAAQAVDAMGGTIAVSSAPGAGATFIVTLPSAAAAR